MGNTNGRIYLNSSRETFDIPKDYGKSDFLLHKDQVSFTEQDGSTKVVDINRYLPRAPSGYPVHEILSINNINPYQFVRFVHPDEDAWYMATVPPYIDSNVYHILKEMRYTYIFTQTGYSIINKNNKAVHPHEFSDGVFLDDVDYTFPRIIVREKQDGVFTYTVETSSTNHVAHRIVFTDEDHRIYKFYMLRAKKICEGHPELLSHFMAQFHAYIFIVKFSHLVFAEFSPSPIPFPMEDLTTIMSYPYLLVADLIMIDNYYSIGDDFAFVMIAAMHFIRMWATRIWHINPLTPFHYGYLGPYYDQAALALQSKVMAHYHLDLKQLEHDAIFAIHK